MMHFGTIARGLAAATLLLAGCGGGGGGGGSSADDASFTLLVSDAPIDQLSTFELTLTGVFLRNPAGQDSANLLSGSRSVDLRALSTRSELLQVARAGLGPWESVRVEFDASSVLARDLLGQLVPVSVVADSAMAMLPQLLQPGAGGRETLDLEIELESSLDDSSGSLRFDPSLRPRRRTGEDRGLDEIHGRVLSVDPGARALQVELRDRDSSSSFGELRVELSSNAVMVDDDGAVFTDADAFFQAASGGFIEAHGGLSSSGRFVTDRIKVDDSSSDDSSRIHVKGVITGLNTGAGLVQMRITRIDKGRSEVLAVLESLGNPSEIELDISNSQIVIEGSNPRPGSSQDLAVGQEIKAKFQTFGSPFMPRRIEIEHSPEFEGRIQSTLGLPGDLIVHLEHHDPAVVSGRVDSSSTDVLVNLAGLADLYLDLSHEPSLPVDQLLPGLKVKVYGQISGPSNGPTIDADTLRVRPGRLRAEVRSIDPGMNRFTVQVERVDDEFGGGPLGGTVQCQLASGARFDGDTGSASGFFALFNSLQSDEVLEVEVFGIARQVDLVDAHEIDARVR